MQQHIQSLPLGDQLKSICQAMAALESVIQYDEPDQADDGMFLHSGRYYTFDQQSGFFKVDNQQGDYLFVQFLQEGNCLVGLDHESEMVRVENGLTEEETRLMYKMGFDSQIAQNLRRKIKYKSILWQGIFDDTPAPFSALKEREEVQRFGATLCLWHFPEDDQWKQGKIDFPEGEDPDGSQYLLSLLRFSPQAFKDWVADYYELSNLDLDTIQDFYAGKPASRAHIQRLNPQCMSFAALSQEFALIGYPCDFEV